jgi:hypothetical protein
MKQQFVYVSPEQKHKEDADVKALFGRDSNPPMWKSGIIFDRSLSVAERVARIAEVKRERDAMKRERDAQRAVKRAEREWFHTATRLTFDDRITDSDRLHARALGIILN